VTDGKPIVLVIDDSAVTVRAVEVLLSRAGYDVRSAGAAEDGLRQARNLVPRVILLDVDLPDLDGYAVCRQLKEDSRTAAIPVILCTARGEALDEADRAGVQAQAYLPKPFSPSGLRDLVSRFAAEG
jgi:CheY-like chemotaxis protein